LREERTAADADRRATAELRVQEANLSTKRKHLDDIMARAAAPLTRLLGQAPPTDPLAVHEALARERERVSGRQIEVAKEMATTRQQMSAAEQTLKEKQRLKEEKNVRIGEFDDSLAFLLADSGYGDDLSEAVRRSREDVEKLRKELARGEANQHTFQEFIDELERTMKAGHEPACPTCNRCFTEVDEAKELRSDLEERVRAIPGQVQGLRKRLERAEAKREQLAEAAGR
jgi:DNA repair exonuclease SbcCD ATPase subunit